jgi:hypothetical protein
VPLDSSIQLRVLIKDPHARWVCREDGGWGDERGDGQKENCHVELVIVDRPSTAQHLKSVCGTCCVQYECVLNCKAMLTECAHCSSALKWPHGISNPITRCGPRPGGRGTRLDSLASFCPLSLPFPSLPSRTYTNIAIAIALPPKKTVFLGPKRYTVVML